MKIIDQLRGRAPVFSFEFFPPKNAEGVARLFESVEELKSYNPAYVSVTYGAGGSTRGLTVDLVNRIQNEIGLTAMAHLTCVGATRQELDDVIGDFQKAGLQNILALRGDPPQGQEHFETTSGGFSHASELVGFIKQKYDFCIAGACYPEVHPEAVDPGADLDALVEKVNAGAEFLITQLFFQSEDYFRLVEQLKERGVDVPVVAGIMPITNVAQVKRFTEMCGALIPGELLKQLEAVEGNPEAVRAVGVQHATEQCRQLLAGGCPGIHFYTLNRSKATRQILEILRNEGRDQAGSITSESEPKVG